MKTYSIKDLEMYSGVKAHTIRIWEKRYNLLHPMRTNTNIRVYDEINLKKMINIATLRESGLKISDIAKFSTEQINEQVLVLNGGPKKFQQLINSLICSMIELDDMRFKKVMVDSIVNIGFEDAIVNVIFPFIVQLDVLWQVNTIKPIHRYFASTIIRQKLIVAIDGLMMNNAEDANRFVLYLPKNEFNEIELLFYTYILKKYRQRTIYLGQNVTISELAGILNIKKPDYIITVFNHVKNKEIIKDYFKRFVQECPLQKALFSVKTPLNKEDIHKNLQIITNPTCFVNWVKGLN